MNVKAAEEKARTRSASKRAGSASMITKPNTVSPKARKSTPNKVKALSTPASGSKPPASVKPPSPSLDTPVKPAKVQLPRSSDSDQVVCKACSICPPNVIRDAVAEVKEELLEASVSINRLNLAARHLILDPNKSLENLGEQAGRVASLCSKVETQFQSLRGLLSAQFNCLNTKVDSLLQSAPAPSDEVMKKIEALNAKIHSLAPAPDPTEGILKAVEALLDKKSQDPPSSKVAGSIEMLTKRLDDLAVENKRLSDASHKAIAKELRNHNDKVMKVILQAPPPTIDETPINLNSSGIKQGSETSPFDELALNFLRDQDLESLVDLLNEMEFTELLGSRLVQYYGQFRYRYGPVEHEANIAYPAIIKIIMEKLNIKYGTNINSCLITKYVDGRAECPPHPDNEPVINPASLIFTLSIGIDGVRNMVFRSLSDNAIVQNLTLPDNSLLVFSRKSQDSYSHAIPADSTVKGTRFSLTFREISPYFLNSTCLIGDSNCWGMNFTTHAKHCFGKWMPGESIHTPRIHQIPGPEELLPYRNVIINVGINDLDRSAPLPPAVLVRQLEEKCYDIHNTYPKVNILLAPVLPTKDRFLNIRVREFNNHLRCLTDKDPRLHLLNHYDKFVMPRSGLLSQDYASRKGHDIKHLNYNGITTLKDSFKDAVMNIRKRARNRNSNRAWNYPAGPSPNSNKNLSISIERYIARNICKEPKSSECESEGSDVEYDMPLLEGDSVVVDNDDQAAQALDSVSGAVVLFMPPEGEVGLPEATTSDSPPHSHPPPS